MENKDEEKIREKVEEDLQKIFPTPDHQPPPSTSDDNEACTGPVIDIVTSVSISPPPYYFVHRGQPQSHDITVVVNRSAQHHRHQKIHHRATRCHQDFAIGKNFFLFLGIILM
ncbi:hypothetical protein RYX36_027147 [Vicia faba]